MVITPNSGFNNLQESIRQWYANKNRDYSSRNDGHENLRGFLRNDFDGIKSCGALELRNQLSERLNLSGRHSSFNNSAVSDHNHSGFRKYVAAQEPGVAEHISRYFKGYMRFEPTAELRPDEILYGAVGKPQSQDDDDEEYEIVSEYFSEDISGSDDDEEEFASARCSEQNSRIEEHTESPVLPSVSKEVQETQEFTDVNFLGGCNFVKWIQFYMNFNADILERIEKFEKDSNQKQRRFVLKKTVIDKINFSAKKKATNTDLAMVMSFFLDLFNFKTVKDCDGNNLQLDESNVPMLEYAMSTACSHYIKQIKWDIDMMETIVLVVVSVCIKSKLFYKVFCATVLNFSTLLKMSISKILDKVISFGNAPSEAATLWIESEKNVFRLFYKVQLALKSQNEVGLAQYVKGPQLIKMFLTNVLQLRLPVLYSSAFIVAEILDNCAKTLQKVDPTFAQQLDSIYLPIADRICAFDWNALLNVIADHLKDMRVGQILRTRNDGLLCQLRNTVQQLSAKSVPTSLTQTKQKSFQMYSLLSDGQKQPDLQQKQQSSGNLDHFSRSTSTNLVQQSAVVVAPRPCAVDNHKEYNELKQKYESERSSMMETIRELEHKLSTQKPTSAPQLPAPVIVKETVPVKVPISEYKEYTELAEAYDSQKRAILAATRNSRLLVQLFRDFPPHMAAPSFPGVQKLHEPLSEKEHSLLLEHLADETVLVPPRSTALNNTSAGESVKNHDLLWWKGLLERSSVSETVLGKYVSHGRQKPINCSILLEDDESENGPKVVSIKLGNSGETTVLDNRICRYQEISAVTLRLYNIQQPSGNLAVFITLPDYGTKDRLVKGLEKGGFVCQTDYKMSC